MNLDEVRFILAYLLDKLWHVFKYIIFILVNSDAMPFPEIDFVYSWVYDKLWLSLYSGKSVEYPAPEQTRDVMVKKQAAWQQACHKIFIKMSEITHMQWEQNTITCYCVGRGYGISDPLTLTPNKTDAAFVNSLTHELIHRLLVANRSSTQSIKAYISDKYPDESKVTINHIAVYAIEAKLHLDLYGKQSLDKIISDTNEPHHSRAWQIVQHEGYDKLLALIKDG